MIEANGASATSHYLLLFGPLCGVVLGAGITWLTQRNEWGRQRRWELKRDATSDAVRGLADLEDAVTNMHTAFTQPEGVLTEEAQKAQMNLRLDAIQHFVYAVRHISAHIS